jgi:3-oxoacyl-[acyl-carrier protein] reductase
LAGCRVLVVSRKLREAEAVAAEIVAAGGAAKGLAADVSRRADMQVMAESAIESFGGIDILCANAGIFPAAKLRSTGSEKLGCEHCRAPTHFWAKSDRAS